MVFNKLADAFSIRLLVAKTVLATRVDAVKLQQYRYERLISPLA